MCPDRIDSPGSCDTDAKPSVGGGAAPAEGAPAGGVPEGASDSAGRRIRWSAFPAMVRRFLLGRFGLIFTIGIAMITLWAGLIAVLHHFSPETSRSLLKMTILHIFTGRASAIAYGRRFGLSLWTLIWANSYLDVMLVLTIFPLIIFAYRNLASLGVFGRWARQAVDGAEQSRGRVARYGMIGLFLFVLFPLYSTGPLVGSIIGYFIGLPIVLNLLVVTAGTVAAIILWVFAFNELYEWLQSFGGNLGNVMPITVVVLVVGMVVLAKVRSFRKKEKRCAAGEAAQAEHPTEAPKGQGKPESGG